MSPLRSVSPKRAAKLASEGKRVSSTLSRRSGLKGGGKIKPKRRKPAEAERIYGPQAFRDWLHQQPCAVSGVRGNIEQAHARGDGMGRKADWTCSFPLAGELHREAHRIGVRSFEAKHGVTLAALAEQTQAAWQARCAAPHKNRGKEI